MILLFILTLIDPLTQCTVAHTQLFSYLFRVVAVQVSLHSWTE